MKIIEEIGSVIVDNLLSNFPQIRISWFIGGSQRFGWASKDSDLDIFMLIEHIGVDDGIYPGEVGKIYSFLKSEKGGRFVQTKIIEVYEPPFDQFTGLKRFVHLNITTVQDSFHNLESEHNEVEKLLNSAMLQHVRTLKEKYEWEGKEIYGFLRSLNKEKKK